MKIDRAYLEQQQKDLQAQYDRQAAELNATHGALLFCRYLLSELDKADTAPAESEETNEVTGS